MISEALGFLIANQLTILAAMLFAIPALKFFRSLYLVHPDLLKLNLRATIRLPEGGEARRQDLWKPFIAFVRHHYLLTFVIVALAGLIYLAFTIDSGKLTQRRPSIVPRDALLTWPGLACGNTNNTKLLVLLHGFTGDFPGTWKRFPDLACADNQLAGVDVLGLEYPTYLIHNNVTIAELADWINASLDTNERYQHYEKRVIIAHSLGGLVGREMIIGRRLAEQSSFGLLIAIATPHKGATPAQLLRIAPLRESLTNELRPGSSYLTSLAKHWEQLKTRPRTVCYTSLADVVVDADSALSQCDRTVTHPYAWGHIDLVKPTDATDARYAMPAQQVAEYMR
jgi:triacylglycerol esterase/lipase EstA (alpha/beta hydrolase family)